MAVSIPALINPKLLEWAREQAGYTIEEVAKILKRPLEQLRAWENGDKQPSVRQAEKLAKKYHCSYSIFSLQEPPKVIPLATEYRRLQGIKPGEESPGLRFALRGMIYRRRIALNLMEELGDSPKEFSLSAKLKENSEDLAIRICKLLNISVEKQFSWKNNSEAWKEWRSAIEATGVLVLLFSNVEHEEVRGVSLFHPSLPVIGINNHEIPSSRPFTLLHEFVHILLKNGMEEKPALEEKRSELEWIEVERFAEKVVGAILIPQNALQNEQSIQIRRPSDEWSIKDIQRLANKYKVTPLAFATRLLFLSFMSPLSYRRWKDNWNEYLTKNPPKDKGGFGTPAQKALNRNGNTLTSLVIDALTLERITPVDASQYLKLNYPYVEELRMFYALGRPLSSHSVESA